MEILSRSHLVPPEPSACAAARRQTIISRLERRRTRIGAGQGNSPPPQTLMAKATMTLKSTLPERESMHYDVVVVGAGPAGLAAAIRLKSLAPDTSVVVVEKGSAVGAHILSGAVIDPIGLDRLTPDWRSDPECPLKTQVAIDQFYYLTETRGMRLPNWAMPKLMGNHGNFIGSLGAVMRWLGARAEVLGVEIFQESRRRSFCMATKGRS